MRVRWLLICLTLACQLAAWGQPGLTTGVCATQAKICAHNCGGVGRDPGCFNHCMEQKGCGGPTPTPTPTPAGLFGAMDVLPHALKAHFGVAHMIPDPQWDDNGFLRNPVWRWAKDQNGQIPDLCGFCPCDSDSPSDWNRRPTCTAQSVYQDSSTLCGYHMNWFPVEYEGLLEWDSHSSWLFDDNDYSFKISRPDHALETIARAGVHLEFDSSETVNHFNQSDTWWDDFHHKVDNSDDKARQAVNGKFAIVIGLLGIDSQHDPHSEIHPVYAMFIKQPSQPTQDRWAFFVRNFGNEGYCGSDEPIPNTQLQVRISGISSGSNVAAINKGVLSSKNVHPFSDNNNPQCANIQWSHEATTDGGLLFTFNLSESDKKCGFVGDLTIDWQRPVIEASPPKSAPRSVQASVEHEIEDPVLRAKIARLDPITRQQLEKQLTDLRGTLVIQPAGPPKEPSRSLPHAKHPPIESALPNYGKGLKPVSDPAKQAKEEKKRQFIDAFLKTHGIQ